MTKISVIMPTYNTAEYFFRTAIESILNQTYQNIELIVVDDGSNTDSIKNIVKSYKDKRLVYINQGHNGAGIARNIGISNSTGDFIYVMASDDTLDKDAFETCINLQNKTNADIILFNLYGQENDGKISTFTAPVPFNITNPGDTTQLVKKDLIVNNNIQYENFSSCNDATFTYTILACAKKVVKINKCFYQYNKNVPNQISSTRGKKSINIIHAFDALKRNLENKKLFNINKEMFYEVFKGCVLSEMTYVNDEKYKDEFFKVLKDKYFYLYKNIFKFKYSIIGKQRINDKRIIYFCGLKLFSYTKQFYANPDIFTIDIMKKKAFLLHKNNINTIIFGASTARDDWIPDDKSFNFGMSSQDLYHSYNLYKWCLQQNMPNVNVVLFLGIFSPGFQLEKSREAYKSIIYKLLYNIPFAFRIGYKYRKFTKKLKKYIKQMNNCDVSQYYGESFYDNNNEINTPELVKKHLKNNQRNNNQIDYVSKIYDMANQNNNRLYIVLPPYRSDYTQCLPERKTMFENLYKLCQDKIKIFDFIDDNRFDMSDFQDCHHLNKKGAKKLTQFITEQMK